jgi:hypothetical protein
MESIATEKHIKVKKIGIDPSQPSQIQLKLIQVSRKYTVRDIIQSATNRNIQ